MQIALLHYASPPVIGGVEQTIYHHARLLADRGHAVRILTGGGARFDSRIDVLVVPQFGARHPEVLATKQQLDQGQVSAGFLELRDRLFGHLCEALSGVDVLVAHNVFTLHKNLALTAALHRLAGRQLPRPALVAWHHDLAWTSPEYQSQLHDGFPWQLLRQPWPGVRHVTVSRARRAELARLYGLAEESIAVVPAGVEPAEFLKWEPLTREIMDRLQLLAADVLLLLPARLTRRKNVEMGLRVLRALRERSGWDARLIVTGPPGPHNPTNAQYLAGLQELSRDLQIEGAVHLLYESWEAIPDAVMADLYGLCDALIFPSRQEGFGIPVLEAGLARLPVFCSDLPVLRETGEGAAHFFDPQGDPSAVAAELARVLDGDAAQRLRRRVLSAYTWERIVDRQILPLLAAEQPAGA